MTSDAPTAPVLADFLPYQLSIASNAVSGRIAQLYQERFGLKVGEWRIMAVLGEAQQRTQRDLVALTLMDKVAVNRACKTLVDRGLAARAPNVQDGRSHHLSLTADGRAMYAEIMPLARATEAQLLEGFSAEDEETLRALLLRIRQRAGSIAAISPDTVR